MSIFPDYEDHYYDAGSIRLHYIACPENGEPIVLLHGLTANAHAFDGLMAAGLADDFQLISLDMRGRGLSDRPAFDYTVEDHAQDILALLDALKIEKATLCGHSLGGLLSIYLAAKYPARIARIIVLDAAAEMNPHTAEMLGPALSRLDRHFPSFDQYITEVKNAPYNTTWDDAMLRYYHADVMEEPGGAVTPRPTLHNMIAVSMSVGAKRWKDLAAAVKQPAVLINGVDEYTMGQPLLPDYKAKETVAMMARGSYVAVDGNHHTMLYGTGAKQIVRSIRLFMKQMRTVAAV